MEPVDAAFHSNPDSLAFVSDRKAAKDYTYNIYSMSDDGRGPTKELTDVTGNNIMPAWSADHTRLAFVHYGINASYNIYLLAADGSEETLVTNDLLLNVDPAWLPSGRKIVFGGREELYVMKLDAGGSAVAVTRLTKNTDVDKQPVVSPDGRRIAFVSDRDGDFDIYVMKVAPESSTNRAVKLTNNVVLDAAPDWSPDGKTIIFSKGREGARNLYKMKAAFQERDADRPTALTTNPADDSDPVWSPDGRRIAFVSDRTGDDEIWRMSAGGTNLVNLTTSPNSEDFQPAW